MALNIAEYLKNNLNQVIVKFQKYKLGFNPEAHQLTSTTRRNRYPEIFRVVAQEYEDQRSSPKNILSFGCSTGEECITIRQYFPNCKIVGADINRKNLRKCKKRIRDSKIKFIYSEPHLISQEAPFDIIFCLSVLCRWEETEQVDNCSSIYPFSKFEQQIALLDSFLDQGGLLIIYNSNFQFSDSRFYHRYKPIRSEMFTDSGFVHKFDSHNHKISGHYGECIFKKLTARSI